MILSQVSSAAFLLSFLHYCLSFQPAHVTPPSKVKDKEIGRQSDKVFSMVSKQDGDGCIDCQSWLLKIDLHHPWWWLSGGCAAACGGSLMESRRNSECGIKPSKMQRLSVDSHYTFIRPIYTKTHVKHNNKLSEYYNPSN